MLFVVAFVVIRIAEQRIAHDHQRLSEALPKGRLFGGGFFALAESVMALLVSSIAICIFPQKNMPPLRAFSLSSNWSTTFYSWLIAVLEYYFSSAKIVLPLPARDTLSKTVSSSSTAAAFI